MTGKHRPEIIKSENVIHTGDVERVELEAFRIKASIWIAVASLVIACVILGIAAYKGRPELQSWATGLISAIAGAAISYGFNSRRG